MVNGGIGGTEKQTARQWAGRVPGLNLRRVPAMFQALGVYYLLAVLLALAAIGYRAGNLTGFSLSNDEGAYLMWAWLVHSGHPLYSDTASVSAPLFIAALDGTFDWLGVSVVSGRVLVLGCFGLLLLSLAWTGRLLRYRAAGLVAALVLGVAPLAFVLAGMAVGEIPSVALAALSVGTALAYWHRGSRIWLALSGLAFCLSLLVKALNPLVALPVLWLVLDHARRRGPAWPNALRGLAIWGALALLPLAVVLLAYHPAALYDQAVAFRFELREAFPWRPSDNLAQLVLFVKQHWGLAGLALAGGVLLARQARWASLLPLVLWLAGALASVLYHSPLFFHHAVLLLPPLALLAGAGLEETVALLRERRRAWGALGLAGALAFLLALPAALAANQAVRTAGFGRETEAIEFLKQVTAPADYVISDNLLLPFMAERQTPPPLGDLAQVAIDSGRQNSGRLLAISQAYPVQAVASWALRLPHLGAYMDWVEANYLVRRAWDNHHVIYFGRRVPPDQIPAPLDVRLGESLELLGYGLQRSSGPAGVSESLHVTLYWQTSRPLAQDYTVFVQLLDQTGRLVVQHDSQPLHGYLPTGSWQPGELIPDRHRLDVPAGLAHGRYQLVAGMYLLETLERLPVRAASGPAGDSVILTQLEIGDESIVGD
jgi:hypothetical protein